MRVEIQGFNAEPLIITAFWNKCFDIDEIMSSSAETPPKFKKYSIRCFNKKRKFVYFTATMAHYSDFILITAEPFNILFDPFQCKYLIFHSHIAWIFGQIQGQKSKWSQAMIETHLKLSNSKKSLSKWTKIANCGFLLFTTITFVSMKKSGA